MRKFFCNIFGLILIFLSTSQSVEAQLPVRKMPVAQALNVEYPSSTDARSLEFAKEELFNQNFMKAIDEVDNVIAADPYHVEAYLLRGYIRELIGMRQEAKMDFQKAQSLNPHAFPAMGYSGDGNQLATLAFNSSDNLKELSYTARYDDYLSYLDEKFSNKFSNIENDVLEKKYDKEWKYLEKAIQFSEKKDYSKAMELTEQLLSEFPESSIGLDMKGLLLMKTNKLNEAERYLQKAVKLDPNFAIAWYNLSVIARKQEKPDLSLNYLNRALTIQADLGKAYFDRALVKKQMGDKSGALDDYNTFIDEQGGNHIEAYLNRGLTLKMLGDFDGALQDINLVIENSDEIASLYKYRGNIHVLMGKTELALQDYNKAIELDPSYEEAYFNRAIAYLNMGFPSKACLDFTESSNLGYKDASEKLRYFCR